MRSILYISPLLLSALVSRSATINATSIAYEDVLIAYVSSSNGDTVFVPAGSARWDDGIIVTKDVFFEFDYNGGDSGWTNGANFSCFITNNTSVSLLDFNSPGGATIQGMSGLHISDVPEDVSPQSTGIVKMRGECPSYRISRVFFNDPNNLCLRFGANSRGVVFNCYFYRANSDNVLWYWNETWAGGVWGDKSWSEPFEFGTTNAHYVEDCIFESPGSMRSCTDTYGGARFVHRYNAHLSMNFASHGTGDGSGRSRGPSQCEIYGNSFTANPSSSKNAIHTRGGSYLVWSNSYVGHTKGDTHHWYLAYRGQSKFGTVDGTRAFDANDISDGAGTPGGAGDGVFALLSATNGSGNEVLVVTGGGMTPSQWKGYIVRVTNSTTYPLGPVFASLVIDNDSTTITVEKSNQAPINKPFEVGNLVEVRRVILGMDMPGCGIGDLLSDASTEPTPVYLNQQLAPIYRWGNTLGGAPLYDVLGDSCIFTNYHLFTDGPSFNGSFGVGVGSSNTMWDITPSITTSAIRTNLVGYWSTNDNTLYQWNQGAGLWQVYYRPLAYPHPLRSGEGSSGGGGGDPPDPPQPGQKRGHSNKANSGKVHIR